MKQYLFGISKEFTKIHWLRFPSAALYSFIAILSALVVGVMLGLIDNLFVKIITYLTFSF